MAENQERRRARRQQRGLLRAEEILQVAGALFAEIGYDKTTTNMIAERANLSTGSLYQFFPNKEAIAQAYATHAIADLQRAYDTLLAADVIDLPFAAFNNILVDTLIAFNRQYPGYFALSLASTLSGSLAHALAGLQKEVSSRLEAIFLARWPHSTLAQRQLSALVAYRIFITLLPFALGSDQERQQAIISELKLVLYRYLAPGLGAQTETI